MSVKKTCFVLLVLLLGVLFTGTYGYAAIASSLSIGEGYVNYGRAKDVYSLPDKDGTVKYYAQIHLQVWQNSVCTGQGNLPLIT